MTALFRTEHGTYDAHMVYSIWEYDTPELIVTETVLVRRTWWGRSIWGSQEFPQPARQGCKVVFHTGAGNFRTVDFPNWTEEGLIHRINSALDRQAREDRMAEWSRQSRHQAFEEAKERAKGCDCEGDMGVTGYHVPGCPNREPLTRDGWPQAEDARNPPMPASDMRAAVSGDLPPLLPPRNYCGAQLVHDPHEHVVTGAQFERLWWCYGDIQKHRDEADRDEERARNNNEPKGDYNS